MKTLKTGEVAYSAEWISTDRIGCLLDSNPNGRIPCLLDCGVSILEQGSFGTIDNSSNGEIWLIKPPAFPDDLLRLAIFFIKSSNSDWLSFPLKSTEWFRLNNDQSRSHIFSSGLAVSNDKMCFPAYNAGIENKVSLHMYSELRGYKQLPFLQTVELPGIKKKWGIHMTSLSGLLTDDKEGALYKYDIPGGKLVWKTEGLTHQPISLQTHLLEWSMWRVNNLRKSMSSTPLLVSCMLCHSMICPETGLQNNPVGSILPCRIMEDSLDGEVYEPWL